MYGINGASVAAFSRNAASFVSGAVVTAGTLHFITQGDATTLTNALSQISNGVAAVATGLGTLVTVGSALYAAWTATHESQVKAVKAAVASGDITGVQISGTPVAPAAPAAPAK